MFSSQLQVWKVFHSYHLTTSEDKGILVRTLIFLFCLVWGCSDTSPASFWPPTSRKRISGSSLWRAGVRGRFISWVGRDVDIFGERRHKLEMRRKLRVIKFNQIHNVYIPLFLLTLFPETCSSWRISTKNDRLALWLWFTLFMMWCGRFSLLLHNFLWFWWTWNCTERRYDGNFRHTVVVTRQADRVTRGVMVSRTMSHVSRDPARENTCPKFYQLIRCNL